MAALDALCDDLLAECAELGQLTAALDSAGWKRRTRFYAWSIYDEIAHLLLFDELAALAVREAAAFRRGQAELEAILAGGVQISEYARERYAGIEGPALGRRWQEGYRLLTGLLRPVDPRARLPWFGPDMSAKSFVTARLMETWAHGQDVIDALGGTRQPAARQRHIAHLGVITFGWSFTNRGLTPPARMPYVCLTGPDGEQSAWGEMSGTDRITGTVRDFCLVVTQRRHYLDTQLAVAGQVAEDWMRIAQCFAGPPAMGPPAGTFAR